jgi:asparagine synthase (glutamine-hydrolysing)
MCGVTGFWQPTGFAEAPARARVLRMAEQISYRGPDDFGAWLDGQAGIAMGHRRLSIVDLSAAGHQPMTSPSGRFVMAFNGEIYNHGALRALLELEVGYALPWRGHSDTETLLAGFDAWGVVQTLQKSIGMFAVCLWDRDQRRLLLARDRAGEKPLYYGWQGQGSERALLFGSELKALQAHPTFAAEIDRESVLLFMRTGYVPTPRCIYLGLQKLQPGTLASFRADGTAPEVTSYWDATQAILQGHAHPLDLSPDEAVAQLETLLTSAIGQQMVADVPLGAFLSGGIDSSTVVALMQAQSKRPVRTFSIGFNEEGYDEAQHAKAVAKHLGTDHTELYVTSQQAMQVVPLLPAMYDEPFADSSQIPTHLVSKLAREHVTVALSGDAGDELFCGYRRYAVTDGLWNKFSRIPAPLRRQGARLLQQVPEAGWDRIAAWAGRLSPRVASYQRVGEKIHKGSRLLSGPNSDALYLRSVSQWANPGSLMPNITEPPTLLTGAATPLHSLPNVPRMMAYDFLTYLPDDILVKVDRAAMAVSLETRVPMLDHRVAEFAWRLPMEYKLRKGSSKWALRQVLYRHVPQALVDRPKMGFGVPIDHWLRGPLRAWAEDLLQPARLEAQGMLAAAPIRAVWDEHISGRSNLQYPLWNVLMFQAWREQAQRAIPA